MPENIEPTYQVIPDENVSPDMTDRTTPWVEQQIAGYRLSDPSQLVARTLIDTFSDNDPNFNVWDQIERDKQWHYVGDLAEAQSKQEYDRLRLMIDINRKDQASWEGGRGGLLGAMDTLLVGALDPVNVIPIPLARGIGIFKGAAIGAAANTVVGGVESALGIQADPTRGADEWMSSVALSTLLGAGFGGVSGGLGAGAVRRQKAIRSYELGLSDIDSPNFSLKPRGSEDFSFKYERGPMNPDGSYSKFKVVDEPRGWAVKTLDGVRYTSEDGMGWVRADQVGRAGPLAVSDDIAETLGTPEPIMGKTAYIDEAAHKREHLKGQWHDEVARYLPDADSTPIERIVLDANDFTNLRTYHDLWKMRLPQMAGESAEAWEIRTGREAMREFRASKSSGDYAGGVIGKMLQRLNFSPMVKAINIFKGDNRITELVTGIAGDYGMASIGAKHGWSAPPSLLLKAIRHVPRLKQFNDAFEAEWLKYASGNQQAKGRQLQSLNVSAAGYALKDGLRRFAGAQVLTKSDFEEMVAEAVFNPNPFEVNGFPVNDNARAAAKAFTQLAQEYDEMHRAAGNFRDQKTLTRDIKKWTRDKIHYEERMMKWLFGTTGQPSAYRTSIRVQTSSGERFFTAESYDAAVQDMIDELGDEGITLSEALERDANYGWMQREAEPPELVLEPGEVPRSQTTVTVNGETIHLVNGRRRWTDEELRSREAETAALKAGDFDAYMAARKARLGETAGAAALDDYDPRLGIEEGFTYGRQSDDIDDSELYPRRYTAEMTEPAWGRDNTLYHGTQDDPATWADADGNLHLTASSNFGGKQFGVSLTDRLHVARDYASRIRGGGPGAFRKGGNVIEIDKSTAGPLEYQETGGEWMAPDSIVIPAGSWRNVPFETIDPNAIPADKMDAFMEWRREYDDYELEALYEELGDAGVRRKFLDEEVEAGATEAGKAQLGAPDQLDEAFFAMKTAGEALDHIAATTSEPSYKALIQRIRSYVDDVRFRVVEKSYMADPALERLFAFYRSRGPDDGGQIMVRGRGYQNPGHYPDIVLHETVHAASLNRINQGRAEGTSTPLGRAVVGLDELRQHLRDVYESDPSIRSDLLDYITADSDEILAYGLTDKHFQNWMKQTILPSGETMWSRFITVMRNLLGLDDTETNALTRLLELTDEILPDEGTPSVLADAIEQGRRRFAEKWADLGYADPNAPRWVGMDEMISQREKGLTPKQAKIYGDFKKAANDAAAEVERLTADLKTVTDMPHQFLNANGKPEPWYHRSWDKAKAATEQEKLIRLITKWYERDNPDGARGRATETLKHILAEDAEITGQGTMSPLKQRMLNMPNSWSIEDPEFGTIKVSDYIDKRILSVAEHYVKRSAVQIEAAKMYGDSQLRAEKVRIREYLTQRYLAPAVTDRQIARAKDKIEHAMGQIDITFRSVAGTLRTTDPLRMDNRIARFARDFTHLTLMGKVAWNSMSEIMRPGMVNGFGTFYHSLFTRYLDDLETMRGNIEFNGLTGELFEMSMQHNHVQAVTIQDGEPVLGGTAMERWISARVPGMFKISGLTGLTTWMKGINGFASQHVVMDMAQQVSKAILRGEQPNPEFTFRLQALGIGPREAIILGNMPVQIKAGGKLILPAIDNWKGMGAEGREAIQLLLNAVHGEMRRAIVTPSIGDRSTVVNGVWTRKGKVVAQSDLMAIPMQFLSYGLGAHNKVLASMIQGRDRSPATGMFMTMLMAMGALWLVTPRDQWRRKTYDQILADSFEKSGIGGFWFNNLNSSLERASMDTYGLRPALGIKPDFKVDDTTPNRIAAALSVLGPAPSKFYDLSRAFWDESISGSRRASIIRRGIPYNNVMWWDGLISSMMNDVGDIATGAK